jgi:hypothetical protein
MNPLLRFISLPIQEKILFVQSIYYLAIFRVKLISASPQALFSLIVNKSVSFKSSGAVCIPLKRIERIITLAKSIIPFSTCLSEALTGYILFSKHGYITEFHIGVSKDAAQNLEAHAWLSFEGEIVLGNLPDLHRFQELPLHFMQGTS